MKFKVKQITKVLFYTLSVIYPVVVFYFLVIRKIPLRQLSLFVIAFALLAFIAGTTKKKLTRVFGPPFLLYGQACFSSA
jgi:hypothetical protein